jgi:hypothetical protein
MRSQTVKKEKEKDGVSVPIKDSPLESKLKKPQNTMKVI